MEMQETISSIINFLVKQLITDSWYTTAFLNIHKRMSLLICVKIQLSASITAYDHTQVGLINLKYTLFKQQSRLITRNHELYIRKERDYIVYRDESKINRDFCSNSCVNFFTSVRIRHLIRRENSCYEFLWEVDEIRVLPSTLRAGLLGDGCSLNEGVMPTYKDECQSSFC